MPLTLYFHPLASFCHKALVALYENDIRFDPVVVDLGDPQSRQAFMAVWPPAKMPVLRDSDRERTVAESTIIIDYLETFYPGPVRLVPDDPDAAWQARLWDRLFDHYVQEPMQKIVVDRLRPDGRGDPFGVEAARTQLGETYAFIEDRLGDGPWALGEAFSLADCSAAPALFYADTVYPIDDRHPVLRAYLARLMDRPSFARALAEAEPYFGMFPLDPKPVIRHDKG